MQNMQNMQIDGSHLLADIMEPDRNAGSSRANGLAGPVSAGAGKNQEAEKLSKGGRPAEVTYQKPQKEKKAGTADDVMQQADYIDAGLMKDKMVVASNTTTTSDCRKVEQEGFSLQQTDVQTIVTVTDKIKMQLAKAGVDISYFGDSLSNGQLQELAGNAALAQELAGRIQELSADIPLTVDNVEECRKALEQAGELHKLNGGAIKFMLDNQLEPTVSNLYKAQYSGSAIYVDESGGQIDFSGMQGQVSAIIAQAGLEENEGTAADSKWLIQNEIPLTPGNLEYLGELKALRFPLDREKLLDGMVTAISEGGKPQDAVLLDSHTLSGKAERAVRAIHWATDEDLAYLINKGEKVTIQNLEQAHNQIQAGAISAEEAKEAARLAEGTLEAEKAAKEAVLDTGTAVQGNIDAEGEGLPGIHPALSTEESGIPAVSGAGGANTQSGPMDGGMPQSTYYTQTQILLITARRQLEEVRLIMTVESSYAMLKQGISVDTGSMEELISQLKQIENNYYKNLLKEGSIEATQSNVSLFAQTADKLEQLKEMPAYALGARNMGISTLEGLHQEGSQMQQNFQQANERYETMQTQARADLGDSIQKAFQNVDDILRDLGQDVSQANERAVRILGYNRVEITVENIARMKAADQQVQMAFHNLTPAVIREFISRGINPMDLDMRELNQQAEQIKDELNIDGPEEKYSEYLYKLEQNNNISKEERSSYIGIYRLMNHIVQSDGAAVGALVNQGAQITMRNLLAAVRTERRGNLDVTVDNSFGELESGGYADSITDQIEAGYQNECVKQAFHEMSPERLRNVANGTEWENLTPEQFLQQLQEAPEDIAAEESYYQQQLDDLVECAKTSKEVYQVLEQFSIPNTMLNVMAVKEMMQDRNAAFRKLFGMGNGRKPDSEKTAEEFMEKNEDGSVEVDFEAIKEELLRRFGEDIRKPEELAKAVAELAECAEKCMSTMIIEPDVTSLDIRGLKLMNAQISIGAKMSESECFSMPIVVDGEITNVTLKIVRNKDQKGLVNITLDTNRFGKIAAELKARHNGITGFIATDSRQTQELLQSVEGKIAQALQEVQDGPLDINYIMSSSLDLNYFGSRGGLGEKMEGQTKGEEEIQTKMLYGMAESFIRVLRQLDDKEIEISE